MGKWLNGLLFLLLLGVGILFALKNQGEMAVDLPGVGVVAEAPLYGVVFVALFVGFLLGVGASLAFSVRHRRRAAQLERQNRDLERELTNLRNLPLDDESL